MAGRITRLEFQKHTAERVSVYLDGQFAFGLPALEAARLQVGQYLTDADIAQLLASDAEQRAYDAAVRFLSYRPRSRAEVRRHLAENAVDPGIIEAVTERLTGQGYLDDGEFARFWVQNREQFRPKGAHALRAEMRQKGLDPDVIEQAIADLDEAGDAYRAAQARARRLATLAQSDPMAFRRKLRDFLLRRGFDGRTVSEVVARLARESGAEDVTEEE